jgi:hypothetical protein
VWSAKGIVMTGSPQSLTRGDDTSAEVLPTRIAVPAEAPHAYEGTSRIQTAARQAVADQLSVNHARPTTATISCRPIENPPRPPMHSLLERPH